MINYLSAPIFHCFFQTARDHRILCRVADTITTWDEITTLGLELNCNPTDVARLRSEIGASKEQLMRSYDRSTHERLDPINQWRPC